MLTRAGFELAPSGYRFATLPFELSSPGELEASYPVCPVDISYMEELKGTEKGKMLFEKDLEVSFFSISCVEGTKTRRPTLKKYALRLHWSHWMKSYIAISASMVWLVCREIFEDSSLRIEVISVMYSVVWQAFMHSLNPVGYASA